MKKALCLFGKIGSSKGKIDLQNEVDIKPLLCGHNSYNLHFKDFDEFDVFIHSWDIEHQDIVEKIYNPKKSLFEAQKMFSNELAVQKIYSRWYSTKESIKLKKQYEEENNFTYDVVVNARFDTIFNDDVLLNWPDPWTGQFMLSHWIGGADQPVYRSKYGLFPRSHDIFMFSSSQDMDLYSTLFDYLDEYAEYDFCYDSNSCIFTSHRLLPIHLLKHKISFDFTQLSHREHFNLYWRILRERKNPPKSPWEYKKQKWAINGYKLVY